MPRVLAQARIKVAVLTTVPANPAAPTVAELNAGISAAGKILDEDFEFSPTDSDKVAEKSLAEANNANALGASNFGAGMTIFRYFNAGTGVADPTEDALFTATKTKGTTLYVYVRRMGKLETVAWAAGDIATGAQVITDTPQDLAGGYIKKRIPMEPQATYPDVAVA